MSIPGLELAVQPWQLIGIGLAVGVLGGFFGVGGAFVVTPFLNLLGYPMAYAIGTDMAHIAGKSAVATATHRRLGHVDWRAGAVLVAGTIPGVEVGARLVMWLEGLGLVDGVVRAAYVVLLAFTGSFMLHEYLAARRLSAACGVDMPLRSRLARSAQAIHLPPMIRLPASGIERISVWILLAVGLFTGALAGFLGVGGGFVRVPALLYVVGMPLPVAVGTDLLEILFSGAYGGFTYALKGRVDFTAVLLMLVGASVGANIGALATRHVKDKRIRLFFALTVLLTAGSIVLRMAGAADAALAVLVGLAAGMSALILVSLLVALILERRSGRAAGASSEHSGESALQQRATSMLTIPLELREEMLAHARSAVPYEACGLLAGTNGLPTAIFKLANMENDRTRYLAEPQAQFQAMKEMRARGMRLLAIYHSHPATEAYPSVTDIEHAYYPESRYVIVSLAGAEPELRAFAIRGGVVEEVNLQWRN